MEEIALMSALVALAAKLTPIIEEKIKSGEISVDDQVKVRADYLAFRALGDAAYAGPEWAQSKQT